jgi:phosphatidate cytidylyltransferase
VTDQHATPVADTDAGPTEPPKKAPRAGRNLPAAIAVGVLLGAVIIAILVFVPRVWVGVVALAVAIATLEVGRRLREGGFAIPMVPLLVGGQAMIWLTWPFGAAGALGAYAGTVVVCMIWRLLGHGLTNPPQNYLRDIATTVFLATWVPLFCSFGALLIYPADGAGRVFCFMLGVIASDVGGFTAGVLFGKHPMVPAISPKKSWEGLAGSVVLGIVVSVLAVTFLAGKPAWVGVPLGLMLVITGTLGDLVESQFKRDLGIKDMGTLLPGHGGLMDRLDSLMPSAVATWIVLSLLA